MALDWNSRDRRKQDVAALRAAASEVRDAKAKMNDSVGGVYTSSADRANATQAVVNSALKRKDKIMDRYR